MLGIFNKCMETKPVCNLSMILACDVNGTIGKGNDLPWKKIDGDLPRFKKLTDGKYIVMGRKTFESLPFPLPGRFHILISRDWKLEDTLRIDDQISTSKAIGVSYVSSIKELLDDIDFDDEEVFVIGGAEICNLLLPYVSTLYITKIPVAVEGDVSLSWLANKNYSKLTKLFSVNSILTSDDKTFGTNQFIVMKRVKVFVFYHRFKNLIVKLFNKVCKHE